MKITPRACKTEHDYWEMRNFLRQVFMLNDRLLQNWQVAYLDFWRWHYILTCQEVPSMEVATLWETESGQLVALLTPVYHDEVYLQVHPDFRTPQLEDEMLAYAEGHHADHTGDGRRILYCAAPAGDSLRQEVLPIGLAHNLVLKKDVPAGRPVRWSDVGLRCRQGSHPGASRNEGAVPARTGALMRKDCLCSCGKASRRSRASSSTTESSPFGAIHVGAVAVKDLSRLHDRLR